MTKEEYRAILIKYIPEAAFEDVYAMIISHKVYLLITRERKTKHGDFRPAVNGKQSRITVNHNLNPYAFLITFLHELAHQITWKKFKNKVSPHGEEWKKAFHELLRIFIENKSFPPEIIGKLDKDSNALYYSTSTDTNLARQLKKYDGETETVMLETLPENTVFIVPDGTRYKKLNKRRKNFLCLNLENHRKYVFNPLAEVMAINE